MRKLDETIINETPELANLADIREHQSRGDAPSTATTNWTAILQSIEAKRSAMLAENAKAKSAASPDKFKKVSKDRRLAKSSVPKWRKDLWAGKSIAADVPVPVEDSYAAKRKKAILSAFADEGEAVANCALWLYGQGKADDSTEVSKSAIVRKLTKLAKPRDPSSIRWRQIERLLMLAAGPSHDAFRDVTVSRYRPLPRLARLTCPTDHNSSDMLEFFRRLKVRREVIRLHEEEQSRMRSLGMVPMGNGWIRQDLVWSAQSHPRVWHVTPGGQAIAPGMTAAPLSTVMSIRPLAAKRAFSSATKWFHSAGIPLAS